MAARELSKQIRGGLEVRVKVADTALDRHAHPRNESVIDEPFCKCYWLAREVLTSYNYK